MNISSAEFVMSNTKLSMCPKPTIPEYAFIGRSNVGKSSLINYLTNNNKLAKTSGTPGKTQHINHFIINKEWYLVDLPGYGYAKQSKSSRSSWERFIWEFLTKRENLMCTFVLIDSRLKPQPIDLEFMEQLALNRIPFVIVFTKKDKITPAELQKNLRLFKETMLETWEEIPPLFISSSEKKTGKEDILKFIQETNLLFHNEE